MGKPLPDWVHRAGTIPGLDGMRAISILIVMASHAISETFPGGLGVYIFFVISGFLIAHLMFSEVAETGRISLRKFYMRRALRLYPALLAFVAVTTVWCLVIGFPVTTLDVSSALLYFANYHRSRPFGIVWSLSVEEHFYFLFPAAMLLLRARPAAVLTLVAAVCVGCLTLRIVTAQTHPELLDGYHFYAHTQYRLDSIAYGVLIAAALRLARGRAILLRLAHPLFTAGALLVIAICLVVRDPLFRETVRYSLLGLSIAVILTGVLFRPVAPARRLLNATPLVWIGQLSYSLYLWHAFVRFAVEQGLPDLQLEIFAPLVVSASFVVAALSYYGLERPLLSLRKRLNPAARTAPAKPPETIAETRPEEPVAVRVTTGAAGY
jgi:peptidoglycan/LPS O-acetylase OafA/YrhL